MSYKSLIQSGIVLAIMLILLAIYFLFFKKSENLIKINEAKIDNNIDNKILELKYNAVDAEGNSYIIESNAGKVSDKEKNVLILEKVKGIIKIQHSEDIIILSDFANYNNFGLRNIAFFHIKI